MYGFEVSVILFYSRRWLQRVLANWKGIDLASDANVPFWSQCNSFLFITLDAKRRTFVVVMGRTRVFLELLPTNNHAAELQTRSQVDSCSKRPRTIALP